MCVHIRNWEKLIEYGKTNFLYLNDSKQYSGKAAMPLQVYLLKWSPLLTISTIDPSYIL